MKLFKKLLPVVCMLGAISAQAQNITRHKTKSTQRKSFNHRDTSVKSDVKKQAYKSKQWRQENVISEESQNDALTSPAVPKSTRKVQPPPPPPPAPPARPATKSKVKNT